MDNQRRNFWKRLTLGIFIVMIIDGLSWLYLWDHYVSTKPREVHADQGRTVPLSSHGIVVYVTESERSKLTLLHYTGMALAAVFLTIYFVKKPFGEWGGKQRFGS
jgi:hypothetical protein